MARPDFFIVGAPKCGTTTLYDWLVDHPQVHAPHKEPCFFSQDIFPTHHLPTHIPSLEAYQDIFTIRDPRQRISGEATPKYLYSDLALEHIVALNPYAKVIVCLRDPVDLMISLHNQKLHEAVETEVNFEQAWQRSFDADNGSPLFGEATIGGNMNYLFWGCVGNRLERLYGLYPRENIKIIVLDDLQHAPRSVYRDLLAFLGIDDDGRADFPVSNPGSRIRSLWLHRHALALKRRVRPTPRTVQPVRRRHGFGIMKLINRLNRQRGFYALTVSDELRSAMHDILKGDTELAESFLSGRKLHKRKTGASS